MSFTKTYPETAFTALGGNRIAPRRLRAAIAATPAITTALEGIRATNYGTQSPDDTSASGRVWGFVFAGAGPLSGPETTALDAIVAAHDGVDVEPDSPHSGGSIGQVWGRKPDGSVGWMSAAAGGITGSLGNQPGVIARTLGTDGNALQDSIGRITNSGTLELAGTDSSDSQFGLRFGHNAGTNERVLIYGKDASPVGVVTHDVFAGHGVAIVAGVSNDAGAWYYSSGAGGSVEWYRYGVPGMFRGFVATRTSTTNVDFSAGSLSTPSGRIHSVGTTRSISTGTTNNVGGTDAGAWAASTIYYIYLIRNTSTGAYQLVASTNSSTPSLVHANFGGAWVAIARISHLRTTTTPTTFVVFVETGLGVEKSRFVDESTSIWSLLSSGSATAVTSVPFMAGATSLTIGVTTNGTSGVNFNISTSLVVRRVCEPVPISSTVVLRNIPVLNSSGGFAYQNLVAAGSTAAIVVHYTYEHFAAVSV